MREEKLFRAIGDVGDDLIARADEPVQKKKPVRWAGIAALAACCLIAVGLARLVTMSMGNTSDSTAALDAAAPEAAMTSNRASTNFPRCSTGRACSQRRSAASPSWLWRVT